MNFTDTHSHLYAEEFDTDRKEVIENAISMGVTKMYLPNIDSSSIDVMLQLEKEYPSNCFAMMGLHPCSVKENVEDEINLVKEWLAKRSFKAVGEIGIDLYWDKTFLKQQEWAFREQMDLALHYNLPIVIHCREAFDEIYTVMKSYSKLPKGIFHCFSGTIEQAQKIIDFGNYKLGIGGVLTFKNSGLDKVVEQLDLQHLVLETDSPYLAPLPHRGKRNESAYLINVVKKLAEIKQCSFDEISEITNKNSDFIFEN